MTFILSFYYMARRNIVYNIIYTNTIPAADTANRTPGAGRLIRGGIRMNDDIKERIAEIEKALRLVEEARDIVDNAVDGTDLKEHFQAYGRYGFDELLGVGNRYYPDLQSLIDNLDGSDE